MEQVTIVIPPNNGDAFIDQSNIINYTPELFFVGVDTIGYTVTDSFGQESNVATATINVNGSYVEIVSNPKCGTVSVDNLNVVTYTPLENFDGVDTFEYRIISHPNGNSNVATVTVTVEPDQIETWTTVDDVYSVDKDRQACLGILDNDSFTVQGQGNQPPIVDAGPDDSIGFTTYDLQGSITDDGLIQPFTFQWHSITSPGVPIVITGWETDLTPTVHLTEGDGLYEFTLTAFDGEFTVVDTVAITVSQN